MTDVSQIQNGVGTIAVNDSFLIEASIYRVLRKYFRTRPFYVELLELLQEV
jgi:farnesyl diphosphate synthase